MPFNTKLSTLLDIGFTFQNYYHAPIKFPDNKVHVYLQEVSLFLHRIPEKEDSLNSFILSLHRDLQFYSKVIAISSVYNFFSVRILLNY